MKLKKRLTSLFLAVALVLVAVVGYASAAGDGIVTYGDSEQEAKHYSFTLDPEGGGSYVAGAAREKVQSGYAHFNITKVSNNTGYPLYINVRTSNLSATVGTANTSIPTGTTSGSYRIYYKSNSGVVGNTYRPSAQTSTNATTAASISGTWRP